MKPQNYDYAAQQGICGIHIIYGKKQRTYLQCRQVLLKNCKMLIPCEEIRIKNTELISY